MKTMVITATAMLAAVLIILSSLAWVNRPSRANPLLNRVSTRVENGVRIVESNGIPDHTTGLFPNANDPFRIRAQSHRFTVPATPRENPQPTVMFVTQFGVAVNGVPFDPAGPFYNGDQKSGWEFEPLNPRIGTHLGVDENNAHTQPSGAYHYHGLPVGLYERLKRENGGETARIIRVGWAADGFPIYGPFGHSDPKDANSPLRPLNPSYRMKSGPRPTPPGGSYDGSFIEDYEYVPGLGDLDECNGRFGVTPDFPQGIYQYYLTQQFPVIPRMFRGTPDKGFNHPGGGPGLGEVPPGLKTFPSIPPPRT